MLGAVAVAVAVAVFAFRILWIISYLIAWSNLARRDIEIWIRPTRCLALASESKTCLTSETCLMKLSRIIRHLSFT